MKKILFCLAFFASPAYSASFDCSKASSLTERTICNNPTISVLDDKLGSAYKSAMSKTNDQSKLKADQIAWIKESRLCGGDSYCLEKSYKERISALSALTSQASINSPMQSKSSLSREQKIELIANELGPSGTAECMAATVTMSAGLAMDKSIKANGPEIKNVNNVMDILGQVKNFHESQNPNFIRAGFFDKQIVGFGNVMRANGWDYIGPKYGQCRDTITRASKQ